MSPLSKTTLLIDSDIVAFKFAAPAQRDYDWGDGVTSRFVEELEAIKPLVDEYLAGLKDTLKADALLVCLSVPSEEGWRKQVLPSYKAHRAGVERPMLLRAVKDYLATAYPSYIRPTLEADDVMGILSTHPKLIPGKKVIVSEDKDMKTIPGWLFNPRKDRKPRLVDEMEADYWHFYQTLTGDTTDGYSGCPGIGPKKAGRILSEGGPMWRRVVEAYEAKGLTEEDALVQARVARICRYTDYDFKKKEVVLWSPVR